LTDQQQGGTAPKQEALASAEPASEESGATIAVAD